MRRNHGWMHSLPMFTHFYRRLASALVLRFSRGNRRPVEPVVLPRKVVRIVVESSTIFIPGIKIRKDGRNSKSYISEIRFLLK